MNLGLKINIIDKTKETKEKNLSHSAVLSLSQVIHIDCHPLPFNFDPAAVVW